MSTTPDQSISLLTPYIRLTKSSAGSYSLWAAIFAPKNYELSGQPQVIVKNPDLVQVNINLDGPKNKPSGKWGVFPLKISLPTPDDGVSSNAQIKVTVWLDDPEDEGSTVTKYDEAEEE